MVSLAKCGVGTAVVVPLAGREAGGTGAEISRLRGSKWGRNSRWGGNGMDGQREYYRGIAAAFPSHPIPIPHARPIQSHDHPWKKQELICPHMECKLNNHYESSCGRPGGKNTAKTWGQNMYF